MGAYLSQYPRAGTTTTGANNFLRVVSGTTATDVSTACTAGHLYTLINNSATAVDIVFGATSSLTANTAVTMQLAVGARFDWLVETNTQYFGALSVDATTAYTVAYWRSS